MDTRNIIIIGASGHAKVIIDIIEKDSTNKIVGLVDSFKPKGEELMGYKILGCEENLPSLIDKYNLTHVVIAIGDNFTRREMYLKIVEISPHLKFMSAIHPSAIIGKDVKVGVGTTIMAGVIINADSVTGDFCILNTNSSLGHDGIMKDFSSISSNTTTGGNVTIGKCSAISLGTNIIQGIKIGKYSIIGAGSLVLNNIDSFTMAFGNPAKAIKKIEKGKKYLYIKK